MEYIIYCIQCIGKSETQLNLRPNDHRKDVNRHNTPHEDQHFKQSNHDFNQHARLILIKKLNNVNIDKGLQSYKIFGTK